MALARGLLRLGAMRKNWIVSLGLAFSLGGCGAAGTSGPNPFLDDSIDDGKNDTGYVNPDGIEVEVDLEGDVDAPSRALKDAPAQVAQFALTYLRQHRTFYLESLAEDVSQRSRVEWQIDGAWMTAAQADAARVPSKERTHFRLRGVNAVLLEEARRGVKVGTQFTAPVPKAPTTIMATAGDSCADHDADIELGQDVYWYLWNPEKAGCQVERTELKLTVSKMFSSQPTTYPEYDQLMEDKKLTVVFLYGQIGHGSLTDSDPGIRAPRRMARDLEEAGFVTAQGPVGVRLLKTLPGGKSIEVDLYDARVFAGLDDERNFGNFQRAISEHEIVIYDGHSMLGASDFWARPTYPSFYQIFMYGGCLGYEYYIRPIVEQKGGWQNLDILSSVIEVTADANTFAAPALNRIFRSVERGQKSSWRSLITTVRDSVGDSTFGASGVRDNCYSPSGSRCR